MSGRVLLGLVTGLLGASLGLAVLTGTARAEDPPPPPPPDADASPERRLDPSDPGYRGARLGDTMAVENVGDEKVIFALGGVEQPVWIKLQGLELRCSSIVIWGHKEKLTSALVERSSPAEDPSAAEQILGPVIHAIYAEGDVFMDRASHQLTAERLLIDFRANQAYFVNAEMRGSMGKGRYGSAVPLTVRASVIRGIARDKYLAENPSFSTSNYARPQLDFTTTWLEVEFDEDSVWFETGWWPMLRMDTVFGKQTPVFVLPKLGGRNFNLRPLQDVTFGSASRFGTSLEVAWGADLEDERGSYGDWTLHTDWRSDRGAGVGLDLDYDGKGRRTGPADEFELRSYYQHDTAREDDFSNRPFDGLVGGDSPADRGRVHLWFRKHFQADEDGTPEFLDGWRLDGEVSHYSDRGFLAEYYRDEVLTEKQQETFLHARRTWGNQGVSLFASQRINEEAVYSVRPADRAVTDFQNQTEYFPSITYHLVNQPLVTLEDTGVVPINLSLQANVAQIERDVDDVLAHRQKRDTGWSGEKVVRGDLEARVTTPFSLGPLHLNPAVGGSLMAQDQANGFARNTLTGDDDGSEQRSTGFWMLRADVEFHRNYDAESQALDLHGLRHVISFDGQYLDRFSVSEDEDTFQENDLIDDLVEQRVGTFRVRNRLQTKRDGEVVDFLDLESGLVYFYDAVPERGMTAFGLREDFAQPLQRLDLPAEEKYRTSDRDGAAFYTQRARIQALSNLWLVGEADYDVDAHELETTLAGARYFYDERLSFYVGRRTIRDDSAIWSVRGDFRRSEKWGFGVGFQHNTRSNKDLQTLVNVFRREPDYTMAVEVHNEELLNELSISLAVYPNDWLSDSKRDPFRDRRPLDYEALRWYR